MRPDLCCVVHPDQQGAICTLSVGHAGTHVAMLGDRWRGWPRSDEDRLPEDVLFDLSWRAGASVDLRTIRRWAANSGVDADRAHAARRFLREHGL